MISGPRVPLMAINVSVAAGIKHNNARWKHTLAAGEDTVTVPFSAVVMPLPG